MTSGWPWPWLQEWQASCDSWCGGETCSPLKIDFVVKAPSCRCCFLLPRAACVAMCMPSCSPQPPLHTHTPPSQRNAAMRLQQPRLGQCNSASSLWGIAMATSNEMCGWGFIFCIIIIILYGGSNRRVDFSWQVCRNEMLGKQKSRRAGPSMARATCSICSEFMWKINCSSGPSRGNSVSNLFLKEWLETRTTFSSIKTF